MKDFVFMNAEEWLKRRAQILDLATGMFRDDIEWQEFNERVIFQQIKFFIENNLLEPGRVKVEDWRSCVLKLSDFTKEGQTYITGGSIEKWLRAMDRKKSPITPEDTSILARELAKQRECS